jgi:Mn2+/Fe2+ NRAMP family transporter
MLGSLKMRLDLVKMKRFDLSNYNLQKAAKALEPLVKSLPYAGQISKAIFALGIIITGLLAVPVLAGSAGYALADGFG